jgi:hypothetical protein
MIFLQRPVFSNRPGFSSQKRKPDIRVMPGGVGFFKTKERGRRRSYLRSSTTSSTGLLAARLVGV